jgi:asparagine synthase (glutamine-hydrolysing)
MSGIFGIVHLDGSPVPEEELHAMRSAMLEWGVDASGVWREGSAGLGSLVSFDTPEAVYEQVPLRSDRGFVLAAEARLDNREELCGDFGIPSNERSTLADGVLCLRAYEKWGAGAPGHLFGDWSFAAWHPLERKLFLARDHFGNTALYYFKDNRRFAFASSRKGLFSLGIPRRLNEFYLACGLISWTAHHGSQTIELDLQRLPPAHTLVLEQNAIQIRQYWHLEDVPRLRLKSPKEYVDAFLPIYDQAVRARLRSRREVGVTLSGGLDSGSVTSLAARALREQGRRLRAYTSVPIYDVSGTVDGGRFGDELPYARAVASSSGNVDLVEIRTSTITPIQAIRQGLEVHEEPVHAAGNSYWLVDLLATARRDGLGVILSGQGGNATISWTGMNRVRQLAQLTMMGHWKSVLKLLSYPWTPVSFIRRMRHLRYGEGLDWSHTAIHPGFARRIGLADRYIEGTGSITNPEEWLGAAQHRYAIIKPGRSFLGSIWAETGAAHGLDVRDPTFDTHVMELTLAIPDSVFVGADGSGRWLIRAAMQDLVPDEVRLSRRRGRQAADLGYRLVHSADEVEGALREIDASSLAQQYVSMERINAVWDALRKEVNPLSTHRAVTILTRGIMAGLFLKRFEAVSA